MGTRVRHLRDDERGMSLALVGLGFIAFFAATTLAVDVGMFMVARAQAQNAADAGALAGAVALALDSFDDRSAGGPAVQSAVTTALQNPVVGAAVSVGPADVTFPVGPSGQSDRVRVDVLRASARDNPVPTLIGSLFGVHTIDIGANATAEAAPANAMTCVRPFTIPDRWIENNGNTTFERYDNRGRVLPNADVYLRPGDEGYEDVRYDSQRDRGTRLVLRAGTGGNIAPTMYYSWKMPEAIGGSYYEENIRACNQSVVTFGYVMQQEPGNMVGPTVQGINDLIAQDPDAYWDEAARVARSPLGRSPRIFPIPLYDPDEFDKGKQTGRNATLIVANWIGFFVEEAVGNEIYGRMTPILGTIDPNAGPAPEGAFPNAVRLVQ
ncbi:MAG: hypothetical protein HY657_06560 [Acidobacteria bacterium]|nr:hypothetical protein [Acidobacteriota bacterium]